jgi:hypothetical protein
MFCVEAFPKAGTLLYPSQFLIVSVTLLYSLILYMPLLCSSTVDFKVEKMPSGISYTVATYWVVICILGEHMARGLFICENLEDLPS